MCLNPQRRISQNHHDKPWGFCLSVQYVLLAYLPWVLRFSKVAMKTSRNSVLLLPCVGTRHAMELIQVAKNSRKPFLKCWINIGMFEVFLFSLSNKPKNHKNVAHERVHCSSDCHETWSTYRGAITSGYLGRFKMEYAGTLMKRKPELHSSIIFCIECKNLTKSYNCIKEPTIIVWGMGTCHFRKSGFFSTSNFISFNSTPIQFKRMFLVPKQIWPFWDINDHFIYIRFF